MRGPVAATWIAAAILSSAAPAGHGNVFGEDRRRQVDASLAPYRSVGMLVHPDERGGGTAFLVGRCHVVTAYHVAFGTLAGGAPAAPARVVEFLIGPDPKRPGTFAQRSRATVVRAGRFAPGSFEGAAGDWAILRLARCLGDTHGFLRVARPVPGEPMPAGPLTTIGFPRSRMGQAGVAVEEGCRARDHGPVAALVGVDCAFESGMSGGPVLERRPGGGLAVVGIVQQSTGEPGRTLAAYTMADRNQMVTVAAFRSALDEVLRAEGRRALARPR